MISRLIIISMAALSWSVHQAVAAPPSEREYREWARKEALMQARLWMLYQRGHLLIEGTVVDEDGKPIPEFVVEYPHARTEKDLAKLDKAVMKGGILGVGDARAEIPDTPGKVTGKNGRLRIDAKYIDFFGLLWFTFRSRDYYDAEVYIDGAISGEESDGLDQAVANSVVAKEWTLPKEVPIKKKFKVVMQKKGKLTKLERSRVDLEIDRKGDYSGYQFALPGKGKSGTVRLAAKEKRFPPRSLFVSLKRDTEGSVLTDGDGYIGRVVPAGAILVLHSAAGDGFIRYEPTLPDTGDETIKYHDVPIRRRMSKAPETGYQSELSLSPDDMRSSGGVYFYFKCGEQYGRGQIVYPVEDAPSKFIFRIAIELQPDGSRNLETGE